MGLARCVGDDSVIMFQMYDQFDRTAVRQLSTTAAAAGGSDSFGTEEIKFAPMGIMGMLGMWEDQCPDALSFMGEVVTGGATAAAAALGADPVTAFIKLFDQRQVLKDASTEVLKCWPLVEQAKGFIFGMSEQVMSKLEPVMGQLGPLAGPFSQIKEALKREKIEPVVDIMKCVMEKISDVDVGKLTSFDQSEPLVKCLDPLKALVAGAAAGAAAGAGPGTAGALAGATLRG